MVLLSIVLPLYNGEDFIKRCLDSVFHSSNLGGSFEVIVIDDGSPDKSLEVIAPYRIIYDNLFVYSQENRGLGEARNVGVNLAKGEYIWFIDQDDWITEGSLGRIFDQIVQERPDILFFEYTYPSGMKSKIFNKKISSKIYNGKDFLNQRFVESPVWQYVIRKEHLRLNNITFYQGFHEDALFTPIVLFLATKVVYVNSVNYIYNLREGSITTSINLYKHCLDSLIVVDNLKNFKSSRCKGIYEKRVFSKYISIPFFSIFYYWRRLNKVERLSISNSLPFHIFFELIIMDTKLKNIMKFVRMKWLKHI